ncbi:hypothetical protein, partial [Dokdonella sp.]|uniref:hypothetical protein n=1 Tax=Dokdonella sp. TaxID=2291710 RepID=UPI002626FCAF
MITKTSKPGVAIVLTGALLALAGCTDKSSPDSIDTRSVERWNHLIAHEAEKAYDYLSPGFRATKTRDDFTAAMNSRPVQWKAAKFKSKTCDEDSCTVLVDVTYSVMMPGAVGKSGDVTTT